MNNNKYENIKAGDLVEFCLDPRYPTLKKDKNSSILKSMYVNVGVVLNNPDKHGYVKIQPAALSKKNHSNIRVEVHVEFCKVVSR